MKTKPKTWEKTREANLLRNGSSGRYYARFVVSRKQKWINLNTDVYSVAKLRLADERSTQERLRLIVANVDAGSATLGELAQILTKRINDRTELAPSPRLRYLRLPSNCRQWAQWIHSVVFVFEVNG